MATVGEACTLSSLSKARVEFSSRKRRVSTARIRPMNREPVSPMKILAGERLNRRKASTAPTSAKDNTARSVNPAAQNQLPKAPAVRQLMEPARPLMPSMRLKALLMTRIRNTERIAEIQMGSGPSKPRKP